MIVCPVCSTANVTSTMVSCRCRRLNAWGTGEAKAALEWGFAPTRGRGRGSIGVRVDGDLYKLDAAASPSALRVFTPSDEKRAAVVEEAVELALASEVIET